MPTIEASKKDLLKLIGKRVNDEKLAETLLYAKCEYEGVGDEIKIEIADANRPDLLSIEGIARQCKLCLGIKKGLQNYNVKKTNYKIKASSKTRPLLVAAVVKNIKFDDATIKQIIQLQEKLCDVFGRKRKEAALGIYDFDKIKWPVKYIDKEPEKIKFVPLEMREEMTGKEILARHPTGIKYAHLLENEEKYPLLIDAAEEVLSMPPIINSNYSGKITEKTKNVFIEVTGYNYRFIIPVLNTVVTALADRGGIIGSVKINNKITPNLEPTSHELTLEEINSVLGTNLSPREVITLLKKYGYDATGNKKIKVEVPAYRQDILDSRDIIEDIAISYNYNKIKPKQIEIISEGSESEIEIFSRKFVYLLTGLGFQEIATNILTSSELLTKKMKIKTGLVQVSNPISELYSVIRPNLLPLSLSFLEKNKTKEYPQKIFEIGKVIEDGKEKTKLIVVSTHKDANFTEIKQILDYLMKNLGIRYKIEEKNDENYIEGRCGSIIVDGIEIGIIGEIHPKTINKFDLEFPIASFEISLEKLLNKEDSFNK